MEEILNKTPWLLWLFVLGGSLILIGCGFWLGLFYSRLQSWQENKSIRQDALKRSKNAILGEVHEKMAPFFPSFPYQVKDCVFVGKGIDFVVFSGLSKKNLEEIVFVEIKTAKSTLNGNERSIRDIVKKGRVRYEEIRF